VSERYPRHAEFRSLTEQEEKYGMLSSGTSGSAPGGRHCLSAYRLKIEGHTVRSLV